MSCMPAQSRAPNLLFLFLRTSVYFVVKIDLINLCASVQSVGRKIESSVFLFAEYVFGAFGSDFGMELDHTFFEAP